MSEQRTDAAERSAHVTRGELAPGEKSTDRCVCCGKVIADRDRTAARVITGLGLRQSCSDACRDRPEWTGWQLPREDDNRLLWRAVRACNLHLKGQQTLREAVMHSFTLGSGYSDHLCRRFGFDPLAKKGRRP